jgi:phosphoglycolate phosphatase-like HAD superfamily hydrolase/ADP-ribose pyrophosphatase YjhB (NUDIX family)
VIRNIIFDWSGTLVDDLSAVWRATNYVFKQAGVAELTLDQFRAEFCLPFKGFYERYVPQVSLPQLEQWFHSHFREVQHLARELPHARDMLQFCRDHGLRTLLLSTIHRDYFATQSAATGLNRFLDHPYIEVWDKRTKILEILQTHELNTDETLFVGDMQHDIETARFGGIFSCAVLTGYNRLDQLRAVEPDLIVEHLGELREMLARQKFEIRSRRDSGPPELNGLPIVTVGALIFNAAGQALMIRTQKWSNLWGIPGGKIKFGEKSVEALRREIREETSLDIEEIKFVFVQDCIHSKEFYRDTHFVLLNYTCRCVGDPQVQLNDEAQEFRWASVHDALAMELNQPTRILIETVLKTGMEAGPTARWTVTGPV